MATNVASKSAIKRAGKLLRHDATASTLANQSDYLSAIDLLEQWRARHATPLLKARMGLQSRLNTVGADTQLVSQRLKRRPTIIDKLVREPHMQLTTMHDIAGCRAVVHTVAEVRAAQHQWQRTGKRKVLREYDYLSEPKASGYRGIHLIVEYDGLLVEVQLRSQLQHAWAVAVEGAGATTGHDLKSGIGPSSSIRLLRLFADLLASTEGLPAPEVDPADLVTAAAQAPQDLLAAIGLAVTGDKITFTY